MSIPSWLARSGTRDSPALFSGPPYSQTDLRKIFTVHAGGALTVQNITKMLITDAARFEREFNGEIPHEIFHGRGGFASLDAMISTPVEMRPAGRSTLAFTTRTASDSASRTKIRSITNMLGVFRRHTRRSRRNLHRWSRETTSSRTTVSSRSWS